MTTHGQTETPHRPRRWPLLVGIGVVTAIVAGAAFRTWGPGTAAPAVHGSAPTPWSGGALPQPARIDAGIPVGYPHTVAGALSAAVHYTEARDLLSPPLVVSELKVMAEPDPKQLGLLAHTGIVDALALRQALGLPPQGTSDQNDYITVQPRAYHLAQQTSDQVEVWLLTWRTTVTNGVQQEHAAYTVPVALTWAAGDWKLDDRSLPTSPKATTPDTAEAATDGWTALT